MSVLLLCCCWLLGWVVAGGTPCDVVVRPVLDVDRRLRAVDGDTIAFHWSVLPPTLNPMRLRLLGIDAPEAGSRARCAEEQHRAEEATAFVRDWLQQPSATWEIAICGWDKWGGRAARC